MRTERKKNSRSGISHIERKDFFYSFEEEDKRAEEEILMKDDDC